MTHVSGTVCMNVRDVLDCSQVLSARE